MRRARRGFTLVELMVALVIVGIVVSLASAQFAAAVTGGRLLADARTALDHDRNADRWLRAAFQSAEVGAQGTAEFQGALHAVRFTSRLRCADGWFVRRDVQLAFAGDSLVARGAIDGPVLLYDGLSDVTFDYLAAQGTDARWVEGWRSPSSPPLAVRIRLRRSTPANSASVDTLLYPIKGRG